MIMRLAYQSVHFRSAALSTPSSYPDWTCEVHLPSASPDPAWFAGGPRFPSALADIPSPAKNNYETKIIVIPFKTKKLIIIIF